MEIIPNWHPIFVHFTVALLVVGVLLHPIALLAGSEDLRRQWAAVARWNLWLGTAFAVLTVATGIQAYNTVAHDTPSHLAMTDHRNWALVTFAVFLALTAWSILRYRARKPINWPLTLALLLSLGLLGSTAWRGGELVFRHGLGVMSLPHAGNHQHEAGEAPHEHPGPTAGTGSPAGQVNEAAPHEHSEDAPHGR